MSEKMGKDNKAKQEESKKESQEIVKPEATAMTRYNEAVGMGVEDLDSTDLTIPLIKLTQGLTREAMNGTAKVGDWINSISEQTYGKELAIVVIRVLKSWVIFGEKGTQDEGRMIARLFHNGVIPTLNPDIIEEKDANGNFTGNVKPSLLEWEKGENGKPDKAPAAALSYTYLVMVNGEDIGNITMSKTALKTAKKLNTLLKLKNEPTFCNQFKLSSEYREDGQKKFYTPAIKPDGKTDEATREKAYNFLMAMRGKSIKLDDQHDDTNASDSEDKPF